MAAAKARDSAYFFGTFFGENFLTPNLVFGQRPTSSFTRNGAHNVGNKKRLAWKIELNVTLFRPLFKI